MTDEQRKRACGRRWMDETPATSDAPDLWSWWIDMKLHGRLPTSDLSLGEQLRHHNAQQIAPLPNTPGD